MLVVLAHPADTASAALVRRWRAHDARLLTAADLSVPGWVVAAPAAPSSASAVPHEGGLAETAVVGGRRIRAEEIRGVLVRVAAVESDQLPAIVPADRAYCAAEMTAFLTWWLTGLGCPVVNRPSAASLAGPGWRAADWRRAALAVGLLPGASSWPASRHRATFLGGVSSAGPSSRFEAAVVVGGRCVGPVNPALDRPAVALARAAGVEVLTVVADPATDPPTFVSAEPWADVADPGVADALLDRLVGAGLTPTSAHR